VNPTIKAGIKIPTNYHDENTQVVFLPFSPHLTPRVHVFLFLIRRGFFRALFAVVCSVEFTRVYLLLKTEMNEFKAAAGGFFWRVFARFVSVFSGPGVWCLLTGNRQPLTSKSRRVLADFSHV